MDDNPTETEKKLLIESNSILNNHSSNSEVTAQNVELRIQTDTVAQKEPTLEITAQESKPKVNFAENVATEPALSAKISGELKSPVKSSLKEPADIILNFPQQEQLKLLLETPQIKNLLAMSTLAPIQKQAQGKGILPVGFLPRPFMKATDTENTQVSTIQQFNFLAEMERRIDCYQRRATL